MNLIMWMYLNVEKTECMTFHTCQKKMELLQLSIARKPIEHVHSFKFTVY